MSNNPPPVPTSKILIVDDDAVVVKALTMKLSGKGFQIISAMDGADAVAAARKERPDLIVLDVTLPSGVDGVSWDGFSVAQWLHRMDSSRQIPIIIITGGDPAKFKDRSKAVGAVAFFQKPVDHDQLLDVIRKTLENPGAPTASGGTPGDSPQI